METRNGKDPAPSINSDSTASFNNSSGVGSSNGNGNGNVNGSSNSNSNKRNADGALAQYLSSTSSSTTTTFENEYDKPSFSIETVQLQFDLNHGLTNLLVSNNIMFLILINSIIRIDLDNPTQINRFQVPSISSVPSISITGSWLHPNGAHLIIQVNSIHYFYLHSSYEQFKLLPRFKNLKVVQICFPSQQDDDNIVGSTTGEFLVAVKEGIIYSALIKYHAETNKRDDKYVKQLYKHPTSNNNNTSLTGLTFTNNNSQINIFIDDNIYIWDCFDWTYAELVNVFKNPAHKIIELPKTKTAIFACNPQAYIYIDPLTNEFQSNDEELVLSQVEKLPAHATIFNSNVILSPHHLIALDNNQEHILIFNKLSSTDAIELSLLKYTVDNEPILGMIADYRLGTYWLYSSNAIYELIINNESVSTWYNYYKMGKYEQALKCLEESPETNYYKTDLILIKQGYDYLQRGGFGSIEDDQVQSLNKDELLELQIKGIRILGKSSEPFEKVCLMLLNLQQHQQSQSQSQSHDKITFGSKTTIVHLVAQILLIEYLKVKFTHAKDIEKNKIRIIILSSWIIELMLRTIYVLGDDLRGENLNDPSSSPSSSSLDVKRFKQKWLESFESDFHKFLASNYKILDQDIIYQIMIELNLPSKFIFFAELIEDYQFILNHYIDINDWENAIKAIIKLYNSSLPNKMDIIYKSSTVLLINSPQSTINTWLKFNESDIHYENFLPAILIYNKSINHIKLYDNYTIKFLTKLIFDKGIKSKQLNNYYLSLLITYPNQDINNNTNSSSKQILKFLHYIRSESGSKGQLYDANFILRLCLNRNQYEAAILILIHDMKLYDSALELSLDNDLPQLAQFVLQEYDRHDNSNGISHSNGNNGNSNGNGYGYGYNGSIEEDYITRTKLEEESFSSRKKLWTSFSRYVIDKVCKGEPIDLDFGDDENNDDNANGSVVDVNDTKNTDKETKSIIDVTKDLVNDIVGNTGDDLQKADHLTHSSQRLSKVLKYILKLSRLNSNDNNGVIGLKDLLPLFPESIMINNFKDEIVKSLNEYNNKINRLSLEMNESLTIARNLKQQMKDSQALDQTSKIYSIIEPGEPCQLCQKLLISKNFIYFPNCHHGHHKDCLVRNYLMLKNDYRFKKIYNNFQKNPTSTINKQELNDILTRSCILCNESNINLIDVGFVDFEKDSSDIVDWQL
ncbi:Pep3/Vps18/deep orange family-domain-containing protein [Scheffersomyces amazonensis]|uniref:Pep3/Vps18/deep orange family-domain-containing protein n=1 Tax=Scheffersomyces amazonensis TaxID=1078765 RepID=UPI00315D9B8D